MNENNSNMNNENMQWTDLNTIGETEPKKPKFIKILISILVILLIAGGLFFGYKKFTEKNEYKENSQIKDSEKDNKVETNENKEPKDEPKEYVYDAKYKKEGLKESYLFFEKQVKLSEIVVPYLNVDTPEAEEINKEIKALFEEFIEMYDEYSQEDTSAEENGTGSFDYIKSNQSYTIQNDIISILIKVNRTGRGSSEAIEYYTFNYDLKAKKRLNLEDVCHKLNLNYEEAIKKVDEDLETSFENTFESDVIPSEEDKKEIAEYIELNKETFTNQLKDKKVKIYIDEKNQLNILVLNEHPFGGCGFYYDFVAITK